MSALQARHELDLVDYDIAAKWFPLDWVTREEPARLAIIFRAGLSPQYVERRVDQGLKHDPNNRAYLAIRAMLKEGKLND